MSLQNLQDEVAEAILSNRLQSDCVHPATRIAIYHNNVISTLLRTLKNTYPLIVKLVGEDFFRVTANEYIRQYPSRSGNLHDYGEYFSDFVAAYQPLKDLIYLAEVAQFEWICHCLCYAAEPTEMNPSILETMQPNDYGNLHFQLHPASALRKFHYPILNIIELCKGNIDGTIDIGEGNLNLLIIRRDVNINLVPLTIADFTFLSSIQDNLSLTEALELTIQIDPGFKLDELLPRWIKEKIIVDCYQE